MINLLNIDCMKYMRGIPDKYFDLAIVDPPYGLGEDGKSNHSRDNRNTTGKAILATRFKVKSWDQKPSASYFKELTRVSKNQIIWGGNHFHLPGSPCYIVWDKNNGSNDFADCELAYTSFNTAVRKFTYTWAGMLQGNMGVKKEKRIHPTQKPVPLYKWLLRNYAKHGDRILDTHGGSMSIAIACYDMRYDLTLCELDTDYFAEGKARYEDHVAKYSPASEIPVNNQGQIKLL